MRIQKYRYVAPDLVTLDTMLSTIRIYQNIDEYNHLRHEREGERRRNRAQHVREQKIDFIKPIIGVSSHSLCIFMCIYSLRFSHMHLNRKSEIYHCHRYHVHSYHVHCLCVQFSNVWLCRTNRKWCQTNTFKRNDREYIDRHCRLSAK